MKCSGSLRTSSCVCTLAPAPAGGDSEGGGCRQGRGRPHAGGRRFLSHLPGASHFTRPPANGTASPATGCPERACQPLLHVGVVGRGPLRRCPWQGPALLFPRTPQTPRPGVFSNCRLQETWAPGLPPLSRNEDQALPQVTRPVWVPPYWPSLCLGAAPSLAALLWPQ